MNVHEPMIQIIHMLAYVWVASLTSMNVGLEFVVPLIYMED